MSWLDHDGRAPLTLLLMEQEAAYVIGELSPSAGVEAMASVLERALARVHLLERRLRDGEQDQVHTIGGTSPPSPRSARAPVPGSGPARRRPLFKSVAQEREAAARLYPLIGQVENVVPINSKRLGGLEHRPGA